MSLPADAIVVSMQHHIHSTLIHEVACFAHKELILSI